MEEKEQKQLLMDLEVVMKSNECPCIVQFYGALFKEVRIYFQTCVHTHYMFNSNNHNTFAILSFHTGGLLDLYGTDGHVIRQIL